MQVLRSCYASLTPREREVMALVVSGLLNKQVGGELDISEITVKAHRGQVMRKMKAGFAPRPGDHGRQTRPANRTKGLRSPKRNDHSDRRAASRRALELERAVQLTRTFPHHHQPQPAAAGEPARVEADAIVRHGQRHHAVGSRQTNRDPLGGRMLRGVPERFLNDAKQRERRTARQVADVLVGVARDRNAGSRR